MSAPPLLRVRQLGRRDYRETWEAMRAFTEQRTAATPSELWVLEHERVFTQGQAGRAEHLLDPGDIPVIQTDRGGQITYHGPGQLVMYLLLSLRETGLGVRSLVSAMENSVIDLLSEHGVQAEARPNAPGVYVADAKIAAVGLRVRRGFTYHGLSFNVDMDLEPFTRINPCGYRGLPVTQARETGITQSPEQLAPALIQHFCRHTGYQIGNPRKSASSLSD